MTCCRRILLSLAGINCLSPRALSYVYFLLTFLALIVPVRDQHLVVYGNIDKLFEIVIKIQV